MKKLIIALISSVLCLFSLCGALLAESGLISNTLGESGAIGDSSTLGESGTIGDSTTIGSLIIVSERVKNALLNGEYIDISGNSTLSAGEMKAIAESGQTVRLKGTGYIITLDGSKIPSDIGDCNFNILISVVKETKTETDTVVFKNSVMLKSAVKGDNRLSFKISVNRSYFNEAQTDERGSLYIADEIGTIDKGEIYYNTYDTEQFANFVMNFISLYVVSEQPPVSVNDEFEVYDPAFGSDEEIETDDPALSFSDAADEEDFVYEDDYDADNDSLADSENGFKNSQFLLNSEKNPSTGAALSVTASVTSLICGVLAFVKKKKK